METEQLIPVIIAFFVAATGWLKSHTEVKAVQRDRETTKVERDTRIALLEAKTVQMEKRLDEGNDRFERFERELKETNNLLRDLLGQFKVLTKDVGVFPVRTLKDVIEREG